MPKPRKSQISLEDTAYYHCVSRCVRRAYLCGKDPLTGKSYEHRRSWVEKRILYLSQIFSIDVCAYAVMSNHTHIVLCVDKELADSWTFEDVIHRWHKVSKGHYLSTAWLNPDKRRQLNQGQVEALASLVESWRERLYSVSWFMRLLNEPIARQANKEDDCTGKFWEGRFKSQALLDKSALIACMAYVDLNPVRAGIAQHPECSPYTSIKQRIHAASRNKQPQNLAPFIGNSSAHRESKKGIAFTLIDYLSLLEESRKSIRQEPEGGKPISKSFAKVGVTPSSWLELTARFESHFSGAVGQETELREYYTRLGQIRPSGIKASQRLLVSSPLV